MRKVIELRTAPDDAVGYLTVLDIPNAHADWSLDPKDPQILVFNNEAALNKALGSLKILYGDIATAIEQLVESAGGPEMTLPPPEYCKSCGRVVKDLEKHNSEHHAPPKAPSLGRR
jgi:hypothetical protein